MQSQELPYPHIMLRVNNISASDCTLSIKQFITHHHLGAQFASKQSLQVGKAGATVPPDRILFQVFEGEVLQKVVVQGP